MAEAMLRNAAGEHRAPLAIASASLDPQHRPIHPTVVQLLTERHLAVPKTVSDPVSSELVDQADLILTMTGAHAIELAGRFRQVTRRVFTLDHAAQVLPGLGDDTLVTWQDRIERTPRAYPQQPGAIDIADPINGTEDVFRSVARQIEQRCDQLAATLTNAAG